MRIALTHNIRLTDAVDEAEFDRPETIEAVERVLRGAGHDVDRIEVTGPASRLVTRLEAFCPDLVFNTAEGRRGRVRRAFYPMLFEQLGLPYTGSDGYALAVTLDKALTKKILAAHGVPSAPGRLMTIASLAHGELDALSYPVIGKPNYEGSSKGVGLDAVADDPLQLARLIETLSPVYSEVLVERYVPGIDVVVAFVEGVSAKVLEPCALTIDGAYPRRYDVLDYALKHDRMASVNAVIPAPLGKGVLDRLRALSTRVIAALDLRDAATLDFRVGHDGEIYFLSATGLPSLATDGHLARACAHAGVSYDAMVLAVVRTSGLRAGLGALVEPSADRARAASRKRASLRVGLAFNLKRIDANPSEQGAFDDSEAEYDSPKTIGAITRAIESYGHSVVPLEATADFPRALMSSGVDVVFNIAEGIRGRNREAQVPSLCELLGIPYTGSDSATLSLCLDKGLSKKILAQHGIETPRGQVLVTGREKLRPLRYPVIVKPNAEGTSKGISGKSVVDDEAGVRAAARELIDRYHQPALVEEYVVGRELTVGLLGERRPRVLPPMEVCFLTQQNRPVYDYTCKQDWERHVRYEVPAKLSRDELKAVERVCRATFAALDCRDVARIDLRLTAEGVPFVIEVNPLPGLTPDYSDLCLIANGAQIEYRTLIGEVLSGAVKRWREKKERAGTSMPPQPIAASAPPPAAPPPSAAADAVESPLAVPTPLRSTHAVSTHPTGHGTEQPS